jgi:two-component system phosphate regulon response regulator PhoB
MADNQWAVSRVAQELRVRGDGLVSSRRSGIRRMIDKEILIVDDEYAIRELLVFALSRAGFIMREAADARSAHTQLADRLPHLLLIDWNLPGTSGLELTRRLKASRHTREVPIILISARAQEADKIAGLENGADDYVTKPFSPLELIARIRAVLRRASSHVVDERLRVHGLTLDPMRHSILVGDLPLHLGPTEYRLLEFFMKNPERAYTRVQILDGVWGGDVYVEERTIDVHVRRLRQVLETVGRDHLVQTVRMVGYRFSAQPVARNDFQTSISMGA